MSFAFAGSFLYKESGLPTSTGAFTHCFHIKRTFTDSGRRQIGTIRSDGEATGHQLFMNDQVNTTTPFGVRTVANYTAPVNAEDAVELNVWDFIALVGSNGNWSVKKWDSTTSAFVTGTVGQTPFAPAVFRWGSDGYGTDPFTGLMAHLRSWNVALTDAQLISEKNSATVVTTSGLVSDHPADGGTIATALSGRTGGAYVNGGSITYSTDQPTFGAGFTGAIVSGTAVLPGVNTPAGTGSSATRVNRILWSGALSDAVWGKASHTVTSGAASAPAGYGTSSRLLAQGNTGGVWQNLTNLPASARGCFSLVCRRVDARYLVLRNLSESNLDGAQGSFDMQTGQWSYTAVVGAPMETPFFGARDVGNGWWLIYIAVSLAGSRVIGFFPTTASGVIAPVSGQSVDLAGFQYEEVNSNIATLHKPTSSQVVTRSLNLIAVTLGASSITPGSTTTATVQLLDDIGAAWDQFSGNSITSSDTTKATIPGAAYTSDFSGRFTATVTAIATGTSNIVATGGDKSSAPVVLTVGGVATNRQIDIRVEPGWGGSSNWFVGIYTKHAVTRFPSVKLFEASGQSFAAYTTPTGATQSRMLVAVPSGVSVTVGQIVEVVIENDNIGGVANDGPGIFSATVI